MAEIDERVLALLALLRRGGLAGLAEIGLRRLEVAEDEIGLEEGEERDQLRAQPNETSNERARRQIDLLDQSVGAALSLEARLPKAILEEIDLIDRAEDGLFPRRVDDGDGLRSSWLESVVVSDGEGEMELTDPRRAELAAKLLNLWKLRLEQTRGEFPDGH